MVATLGAAGKSHAGHRAQLQANSPPATAGKHPLHLTTFLKTRVIHLILYLQFVECLLSEIGFSSVEQLDVPYTKDYSVGFKRRPLFVFTK